MVLELKGKCALVSLASEGAQVFAAARSRDKIVTWAEVRRMCRPWRSNSVISLRGTWRRHRLLEWGDCRIAASKLNPGLADFPAHC